MGRLGSAKVQKESPRVIVRGDGYVHAGSICALNGRTIFDFLERAGGKTDAWEIASQLGIEPGFSLRTGRPGLWEQGQPLPLVQGYGPAGVENEHRPAWVHPALACHLLDWVGPGKAAPHARALRCSKVVVMPGGTMLELQVGEADGHVNATRLFAETEAAGEAFLRKKPVRQHLEAIALLQGRPCGMDMAAKRAMEWDGSGLTPLLFVDDRNKEVWCGVHAALAIAGALDMETQAAITHIVLGAGPG